MSELLTPGQTFAEGRYRIERFLAQGGFGAVFVAEQIATEMQVAIKVLHPHVLASKQAVEKFQLEAKVAARVKSEFIVKVLDAGFDKEAQLLFLAMELLEGKPLEDVVVESGPRSLEETAVLMKQFAAGLDRAHGYTDKAGVRTPIVHRDLKPENLFLTYRETGEPVVKILDFGIAKVLSENTNVSQDIKGTPLYMAYEQAVGERITPQTDIWAMGLIAYFLLSGRSYWKSASNPSGGVASLFGEVLTMDFDAASVRVRSEGFEPAWPPAFDGWFARCVNRDPAARFATAGEAARELEGALLGPGSLGYRSRADVSGTEVIPASSAEAFRASREPEVSSPVASGTNDGEAVGVAVVAETLGQTDQRLAMSHTTGETLTPPPRRAGFRAGGLALVAAVLGGAVVVALRFGGAEASGQAAAPEVLGSEDVGDVAVQKDSVAVVPDVAPSADPSAGVAPVPSDDPPAAAASVRVRVPKSPSPPRARARAKTPPKSDPRPAETAKPEPKPATPPGDAYGER